MVLVLVLVLNRTLRGRFRCVWGGGLASLFRMLTLIVAVPCLNSQWMGIIVQAAGLHGRVVHLFLTEILSLCCGNAARLKQPTVPISPSNYDKFYCERIPSICQADIGHTGNARPFQGDPRRPLVLFKSTFKIIQELFCVPPKLR